MDEDLGGGAVAGVLELGGPEEAVEADDVLADEVVDLGLGVLPPVLEGLPAFLGPSPEGGHVADGGVEPDVEVLVVVAGDLEAEVGGVAGDVPAAEGLVEPLQQLFGGALVGVVGEPALEEVAAGLELHEELLALAHDGRAAADGAVGLLQLGGVVGGAADRAVVAVAVGCAAAGAGALDEAVGQEHPATLAVELVDGARGDEAALLEAEVDLLGEDAVLLAVGGAVAVEAHLEGAELLHPGLVGTGDDGLGRGALLAGADHDGRAVGVVGADVDHVVPHHALVARPEVGLQVFHQVAQVERAVRVRQRTRHDDFPLVHGRSSLSLRAGWARRRRAGGAGRTSPCRGVGRRPTAFPAFPFPFFSSLISRA